MIKSCKISLYNTTGINKPDQMQKLLELDWSGLFT